MGLCIRSKSKNYKGLTSDIQHILSAIGPRGTTCSASNGECGKQRTQLEEKLGHRGTGDLAIQHHTGQITCTASTLCTVRIPVTSQYFLTDQNIPSSWDYCIVLFLA